MTKTLQIALGALAIAGPLVCGGAALPVLGRLTADDGTTVLRGTYLLEGTLITNVVRGASVSSATATVETDAEGFYAATLALDAEAAFAVSGDVFLKQVFRTASGAVVATLPPQRLGFAPYALHASSADRVEEDDLAVTELASSTVLAADEIAVSNRLLSVGLLIVTNAIAATGQSSVVKVDRLSLGAEGTSLLAASGWTEDVCAAGSTVSLQTAAVCEGIYECVVTGTGTARVTLVRTAADGVRESLVDDLTVSLGAAGRNWKFPVRKGDAVDVSVSCGTDASALVRTRLIGFGREK